MVVAHGFSRLGGIEEVSRQVISCLGQDSKLRVTGVEVGTSISSRIKAAVVLWAWLVLGKSVIVMHAAILQRYNFSTMIRDSLRDQTTMQYTYRSQLRCK